MGGVALPEGFGLGLQCRPHSFGHVCQCFQFSAEHHLFELENADYCLIIISNPRHLWMTTKSQLCHLFLLLIYEQTDVLTLNTVCSTV